MKYQGWLLLCIALLLVGCVNACSNGEWKDSEVDKEIDRHVATAQGQIDKQIIEEIKKTFPLPDSVTIINHVGNVVRFYTDLDIKGVVDFYRDAYTKKGWTERASSTNITLKDATLVFEQNGKEISVRVVTQNNRTMVTLTQ